MRVKEIIKSVALLIGDSELAEYVLTQNGVKRLSDEYANILSMVNLVVNETAQYIPLLFEEDIKVIDGKVLYSSLSKRAVKIFNLFDDKGEEMEYKERLDYLTCKENAKRIKYSYVPETLTDQDDIPFKESSLASSLIIYGVTANYCIYQNRFDEASLWNERYANGVKNLVLVKEEVIKEEQIQETEVKELKNAVIKDRYFL